MIRCDETNSGSLEARVGIEPTHKGFADLSLTTWVPRPILTLPFPLIHENTNLRFARAAKTAKWSGRRDLNPRLRPWQGRTLPLSYSRSGATLDYIAG